MCFERFVRKMLLWTVSLLEMSKKAMVCIWGAGVVLYDWNLPCEITALVLAYSKDQHKQLHKNPWARVLHYIQVFQSCGASQDETKTKVDVDHWKISENWELKVIDIYLHFHVFITGQFRVVRIYKQPRCPSTDQWINW